MKINQILGELLIVGCVAAQILGAQIPSPNCPALDVQEVKQILWKPDAMRKLASVCGGHYVAEDTREPGGIVEYSIETASARASLVLVGKVIAERAQLVHRGDDIYTNYTIQPEKVLKGTESSDVTVVVRGGKITFPNGDTAEINSIPSSHIADGGTYLFFLKKNADGNYWPLGQYQTIIGLDTSGSIEPLAKYNTHRHHAILDQLHDELLTSSDILVMRVKQAISAQTDEK